MSDARIPVTLLTGFLGAGKTTLLNRILRQRPIGGAAPPIAVVVNEVGAVGIDHDLVRPGREPDATTLLAGGCLCCRVAGELSRSLQQLALDRFRGRVPWFERLVIETSGLADPAPILQMAIGDPAIRHAYRLAGTITVVDAVHGGATLDRHAEAVKQVALADRIVLGKVELTDPATVEQLRRRLRRLAPHATIIEPAAGVLDPADLLEETAACRGVPTDGGAPTDGLGAGPCGTAGGVAPHGAAGHGRHDPAFLTMAWRQEAPVPMARVTLFQDRLRAVAGADLLRMKAIVRRVEDPERPCILHAVQHVVAAPETWPRWPSADRDSRLVLVLGGQEPTAMADLAATLLPSARPVPPA